MNSSEWIDARTACAVLGVKPQTLYTYVSRGQLRAQADAEDSRRSLYSQADVDALLRRNRRPRTRAGVAEQAIRWGDPVLVTAISELRNEVLWLRGRSLLDCAETMTLEQMACHLWDADAVEVPPSGENVPQGADALGRALTLLSGLVAQVPTMQGRIETDIVREGAALVSAVATALSGRSGPGPVHLRLAAAWGCDAEGAEDLRRALVLMSDHELNPSTFAVRIAASTGASLPAALLSGLATLSGPRHGGVAGHARAAVEAAQSGNMAAFLAAKSDVSPYRYGFGHPLYPGGDPRARMILERLDADSGPVRAIHQLSGAIGLAPNIDVALAALSLNRHLPRDADFTLFSAGRVVGWIAHAIEQVESGEVIRPRARYRG